MWLKCTVDIVVASEHWRYTHWWLLQIFVTLKEKIVPTNLTTGNPPLWKITTRPPLSPVAKYSPSWLNSTVEMISAGYLKTMQVISSVLIYQCYWHSEYCLKIMYNRFAVITHWIINYLLRFVPSATSSSIVPFTWEKTQGIWPPPAVKAIQNSKVNKHKQTTSLEGLIRCPFSTSAHFCNAEILFL